MKAVTLGPAGTYSHRAAGAVADDEDIEFTESVTAIVESIAGGEYDRGVVPDRKSVV